MESDCDAVGDADAVSGGGGLYCDGVCASDAEGDADAVGGRCRVWVLPLVAVNSSVDDGVMAEVGPVAVIGTDSEGLDEASLVAEGACSCDAVWSSESEADCRGVGVAAVNDSEEETCSDSEGLWANESVGAERETVLSLFEFVAVIGSVGVPAVSDADADSCAVNESVLPKLAVLLT